MTRICAATKIICNGADEILNKQGFDPIYYDQPNEKKPMELIVRARYGDTFEFYDIEVNVSEWSYKVLERTQ